MSGHRRVKNLDYDEDEDYDDYDDYDDTATGLGAQGGEDEITEEDRQQLDEGTIKVRQRLADSSHISDKAIQDALWHYWFDVDKTVVYLKNESQPKTQTKAPKAGSRFDQAADALAAKAPVPVTNGESFSIEDRLGLGTSDNSSWLESRISLPRSRSTNQVDLHDLLVARKPLDLFEGIPWSHPLSARNTVFLPIDARPRLRLLGGSGKPSKLAALAAARKAKENNNPRSNAGVDDSQKSSNAVSLLDRLSSKDSGVKASPHPARPSPVLKERQSQRALPVRDAEAAHTPVKPPTTEVKQSQAPPPGPSPRKRPRLDCSPTVFGATLCGSVGQTTWELDKASWTSRITHAVFGRPDLPPADFSDPSPDARVLQAQAKGKKTDTPTKAKTSRTTEATKGVADLKISQEPKAVATKVKSKNINVAEAHAKAPGKRELSFVVVGHIDHGKSTLMGRLLYEHKVISQRALDKHRKEAARIGKESFALAWVMDARDDEREHGVTIDYAERTFSTAKTDFTILDAPGHRDFVGNMIAGTSMADFALLVVDAGANSFAAGLKGQTREHAQVVRCMKLEKMVVAVNKMDSVGWDKGAFEGIKQQALAFLEETLFKPEDVVFVPVSGLTGENILSKPEKAGWYTGPTLVQALDDIRPRTEQYLGKIGDPFRLRITGFSGLSEWADLMGPGGGNDPFTAYGRVEAGNVQVGDRIVALPSNEKAVVKGISKHGDAVDWAVPGQLVGLQLVECDEERFNKGDLICDLARPAKVGALVTIKVLAFNAVFPMPVDIHRGRLRAQGTVTEMVALLDPKTGEVKRENPKAIKFGEVGRVKIELDELGALEHGTRVVLRDGGETVAAGAVERIEQSASASM